ncbi:hypothetical protein [Citreimonas salinaria]|uniref:Uncharacterized protein n=1 Tax=Citreimonas salinaria TaxID=321339 RepID=A0A1H3L6Z0_9RHOB|nr:hypothetical protein [Citreimonas salinaria]SDY59655.1 hypothetical protein SAMN05444340_111106 [Citreimonas salinaria]
MAEKKKTPRWLFAAIPLGFVLLVGIMLLVGERTGGPTTNPYESGDILETSQSPELDPEVVVDPDGVQEPFVPTPSGPEYDDNDTVIDDNVVTE